MTQLESARKGVTTPEMVQAAKYEGGPRRRYAAGWRKAPW